MPLPLALLRGFARALENQMLLRQWQESLEVIPSPRVTRRTASNRRPTHPGNILAEMWSLIPLLVRQSCTSLCVVICLRVYVPLL